MKTRFQKILVIDNFDSFTYNLVDILRQLKADVQVVRNDISLPELKSFDFDLLLLSPGPSHPSNAGSLMEIIAHFADKKPIFGVCLGHQALAIHFGATVETVKAQHGKPHSIEHEGQSIFKGLPNKVVVGRYHSLAVTNLGENLIQLAASTDGVNMALRHKTMPIVSVQFHPESILSLEDNSGFLLLKNVVEGEWVGELQLG